VGQGVTVFRRDEGRVYVAVDWGQSGGGHGHPDRLNVMFSHDDVRWLDDLGTGSYLDVSLHWYRSTLAHNAPLINGASQRQVDGRVVAYDERGGVGWILAAADGIAPGVHVERAIIVTPDYVVDEVRWTSADNVRFELPFHFDADVMLPLQEANLDGGNGLEDGFAFARPARSAPVAAGETLQLVASRATRTARVWTRSESEVTWFEAFAPGQPATSQRRFHVIRSTGRAGMLRSVWTWDSRVDRVEFTREHLTVFLGEEAHVHRRTDEYWSMEMTAGHAHSGIELYGWKTYGQTETDTAEVAGRIPDPVILPRDGSPVTIVLGEDHYRRSEESWREAGRPTAAVVFVRRDDRLELTVRVPAREMVIPEPHATNPFDNEHPDVNSHGVFVYLKSAAGAPGSGGAWSIGPERDSSNAHVRNVGAWGVESARPLRAEWSRTAEGYEISADFPLEDDASIDVIVNDIAPGRTRRRGQLVLSGARGEFVYLRGDRHDPARLIPIRMG
jgi:hypothetical protein